MAMDIEKLKQKISRSDLRNNLKYVNSKSKSNNSTSEKKDKKVVRIDSNTTVIKQTREDDNAETEESPPSPDAVTKIYERTRTPDVPIITELKPDKSSVQFTVANTSSAQTTKSTESIPLMQVSSNGSVMFGSESEPIRTQSAPEIVQSSVFSDSCKSCESMQVEIKYYKYGAIICKAQHLGNKSG